MWSSEKSMGARHFRASAAIGAAVLAATVIVLVTAATKPAEAAFPGASGAIAFTSGVTVSTLDVWRMAPDGFGATNLTEDTAANDSQPAWSPEGTQIAFVSQRDDGDGTNDQDIYRMNAAGNGERPLTTDPALDLEPSWFPSETKIAFRRNEAGTDANIWVLTLDENGNPIDEQRLTTNTASDVMPTVSPNGKLIAFSSDRDGDREIYVMKANIPEGPTNVPKKLTKNTNANPLLAVDWNPDWSPNGKKIVFESNRDGDDEIFVMNADGTRQKNLTRNTRSDIDPVFSPDGKKIAFERFNPPGSSRDIFRMRADGTRQSNLTESTAIDANPSWQPMP